MTSPSVPLESRFWSRVAKTETCWLWSGALAARDKDGDGYGHFAYQRRHYGAHRYSYELHFGAISDALQVCHHCDVRRCVRPDHLFLGTVRDNALDASAKGRMNNGEANGMAKLNEQAVTSIRRAWTGRRGQLSALAREHNVSEGAVRFVVRGTTWKSERLKLMAKDAQ